MLLLLLLLLLLMMMMMMMIQSKHNVRESGTTSRNDAVSATQCGDYLTREENATAVLLACSYMFLRRSWERDMVSMLILL